VSFDGIAHWDGNAWTFYTDPAFQNLRQIWGLAADDIYAAGDDGLLLHYDGVSWSPMVSPTNATLRALWGDSSSSVWAGGSSGSLMHFTGTLP